MTTPHLHVFAIKPGESTAWCRLTVPRLSIFSTDDSAILERDYGVWHGEAPAQAIQAARLVVTVQGLDYKTGPAVISERWDQDIEELWPASINSMLRLLHYEKRMGDATFHLLSKKVARHAVNDSLLHKARMYVEQPDIRDAHRLAITTLRRARENRSFAHELWPYPANGLP